MDTYRGLYEDRHDDPARDYEPAEEAGANEAPPSPVGQDERRMQVRAYNHWAGLLAERSFPSIEDLDPDALPDFGPYSVLLDFTAGIENPAIQFLGDKLAAECGADASIRHLDDVPSRSLLSRITDHYMQILANQAPIGFEAEFVNQRGQTILYRGILLPFSSDDDTIDFIYGVINWKELADQLTTDELMLEIDQALDAEHHARRDDAMTVWADGPAATPDEDAGDDGDEDDVLDLASPVGADEEAPVAWPEPSFGAPESTGEPPAADPFAAAADALELAVADAMELGAETMGLADWLASARELAQAAHSSEDRTRGALYAAIGRAYDFALAAHDEPEEFHDLIADAGLTMQDRAPMTPVVKLVFGADYDKTRLTEYAAALGHAQRNGIARGGLGEFLMTAPGGLKGVVQAERAHRKAESGKPVVVREAPREALAKKLRKLAPVDFAELSPDGSEFALLVARRLPTGEIVLLGEVPEDVPLLERAARRLLD
ncbi:MAG TPA: hypothetical protein VM055_03600 [Novosphingobium sp.]|nr:hypothetical protein [Novosphingobium sp.]